MRRYKGSLGIAVTGGLGGEVTPWAGISVLVELYRKAGVEAAVERALPKKKSRKGLRQGQMVECFVLLSALGGDCVEDMERLRADTGLKAILGYRVPAAETSKANAQYCYAGYRAFQPVEVEWAETGLVLADEFRQGNVLAGHGMREIVDSAYNMLPAGSWRVRVRSDSAAYQQEVLDHWQERGWGFAVFTQFGRVVHHAGRVLLRIATTAWEVLVANVLERMAALSPG